MNQLLLDESGKIDLIISCIPILVPVIAKIKRNNNDIKIVVIISLIIFLQLHFLTSIRKYDVDTTNIRFPSAPKYLNNVSIKLSISDIVEIF